MKKADVSLKWLTRLQQHLTQPGIARFLGILPFVTLLAALGSSAAAAFMLQRVVAEQANTEQFSIAKSPLPAGDLSNIARRLGDLNPAVKVKGENGKLSIQAESPANYVEFLYALNTLPTLEKQVVWEMPMLCIADCPNKSAFEAELTGYKQRIQSSKSN